MPPRRAGSWRTRGRFGGASLLKVIAKESVLAPVAGMFYQAVVAAGLLYGSESWILPKAQLRAL